MGLEIAMILLAAFFRFGKIIVNININIGKNAKKPANKSQAFS